MFISRPARTLASAILGLTLIGCSSAHSIDKVIAPQTLDSANAILQPWVSDTEPGVAVAISLNDEIIFARGAGLANLEYNQPITPDSVFQIASVSKQFTAFATLLLVSEGKIDLDADIRTYIPELYQPPQPITVRHLLNHTSGLRERNTLAAMAGWLEDDIQTEAQLLELVTRQSGVNFQAGEEVEYSNTGYALLAEIVARVSGKSFQTFTQDRIFTPLGMSQTRFRDNRNDLIIGRASSYYPSGGVFKNVVSASETLGSTGLYTTALDLLKWADNFESQTVGDDTVFRLMAARAEALNGEDSTFAKGQELRAYQGIKTWSHGGRDAGYRSFLLRAPDQDFAVSILSNRTDFDTAKLAFALTDTFLKDMPNYQKETPAAWERATLEELNAFAGDYEFYPGVIFTLTADEEGLKFAPLGAPRKALEALPQIGKHQFMLNPNADISITFTDLRDGQSRGFDYTIGLHGTLKAKRIDLVSFDPATINAADYTGTYESSELATQYVLTHEDGQLIAKTSRLPSFTLSPYQADTFASATGPLQKVDFTRDESGRVSGLYASAALAERVAFSRIHP